MADSDYKTTIRIEGDEKGATGAISRVVGALGTIGSTALRVSRMISRALSVFSRLTWIVSSVQLVIEGLKRLRDWMDRAAAAAAELRRNLALDGVDTRLAHAVTRYKQLCDQITQANKLEKERNQILDERRARERDLDDANAELGRQREIAALDPAAKDYQERVGEINRRYQRQAAETAAARGDENAELLAKALRAEADRKYQEAAELRREYERRDRITDRAVENRNDLERELQRDPKNEKLAEAAKRADEQWKTAFDAAKEVENAMIAAEREADSLLRRAGEVLGLDIVARNRRDARLLEIDSAEKREAAERKRRTDEDERRAQREQWKFEERMSSAQEREDFDQKLKSADDEEKVRLLSEREAAKREKKERALVVLKEEMAKPTEARSEEHVVELRRQAEEAQRDEYRARDQREDIVGRQSNDAQQRFDDHLDRFVGVAEPSGNRLTAMGLGAGSGVERVQEQMVNSLKELVRLGQQQIAEIKAGNIRAADNVAVYGD